MITHHDWGRPLFSADKLDSLATVLKDWLERYDKQLHPKSDDMAGLERKCSAIAGRAFEG